MGTHGGRQDPLTDEVLAATVEAWRKAGSKLGAAEKLGLAHSTIHDRLKKAAERGLLLDEPPAMQGFRISQVTNTPNGGQFVQQKPERGPEFEMPPGHRLKGVSTLVDENGRTVLEWRKTREGELDPLELV